MKCEVCRADDATEYHLRQHRRDGDYDDYEMTLCQGCYNLRASQDWIEVVDSD